MITRLITKAKKNNDFERGFFKSMNKLVLGKTKDNVRKHRYIKVTTTEKKKKSFSVAKKYHIKNGSHIIYWQSK